MEWILGRDSGYTYTARRNDSLSSLGRIRIVGFIAVVSLGIATVFACLGAWPILPFAGVEVLVLICAFRYVERHAHDYERVTLDGDMLRIELTEARRVRQFQFNRCWAQLICERDGSRLALRSHGREVEFGRHLTAEQRLAVAGTLGHHLRHR